MLNNSSDPSIQQCPHLLSPGLSDGVPCSVTLFFAIYLAHTADVLLCVAAVAQTLAARAAADCSSYALCENLTRCGSNSIPSTWLFQRNALLICQWLFMLLFCKNMDGIEFCQLHANHVSFLLRKSYFTIITFFIILLPSRSCKIRKMFFKVACLTGLFEYTLKPISWCFQPCI